MMFPLVSAMFVSLGMGMSSPVQDTTLQSQLKSALGTPNDAAILVDTLVSPLWPGVAFYRARRIPPWPHGEDPRPAVVSGVVRGGDTLITWGWEHLPGLWTMFRPQDVSEPEVVLDRLLKLLDLTSIAPSVRLVLSPEAALASAVGWSRQDTIALRDVGIPRAQRIGPATAATLYVRETGGVFQVIVLVTDGGVLEYSIATVLETSLSH